MTGVVLGLLTALGHSMAYLATRWYTQDRGWPTTQLLVLAHVIMGVLCAACLPLVWPEGLGLAGRWVWPYLGLIGFFVVAQSCLIGSLRFADASRVAPLLGLKVALLAVISVVLGAKLSMGQWGGVALAVGSAWVLNGVGGRMPWQAPTLVLTACLFYAIADTLILKTIGAARQITGDHSAMGVPIWCVAVAYSGVGLIATCLLPLWGTRKWKAWRDALPYAGCWMSAMVTLYATFAALGTVLGAILQSTRGLMSIALGVALAHLGWHHLEQKHGASVVWRRLGAAALMTAAVALYVLCRPQGS